MDIKIVGIISEMIGKDPFHPRSFSGASAPFFTALRQRNSLHRAFGVSNGPLTNKLLLLKNFHPNLAKWRQRFSTDLSRRNLLTKEIKRNLTAEDMHHPILQLGSYYDSPSCVDGKTDCYSFHDSNLAARMKSSFAKELGLDSKRMKETLAYERAVNTAMDGVFTFSEYTRRSFINDYGIPANRVITVGTGVNLRSVPELVAKKDYDSQEILFIGIEFERKGGWNLLEAFSNIRSSFPRAKLHIVGPKSLDVPVKWSKGVTFHGYLSKQIPEQDKKLRDLFRNSSLFVLPSLYDPMPNVVIEAMAHQLPVVATNDWGIPEMVLNDRVGKLVECGSVENLQETLRALLLNPEELRKMGENARPHALNEFTWNNVANRLVTGLLSLRSASVNNRLATG